MTENRDFYNNYYLNDNLSSWRRVGARAKVSNIKSLLGDLSSIKILEVGCGEGAVLQTISENYADCELFGCDISSSAINSLKSRKIPGLKDAFVYEHGIKFSDGYFDFVIMTHVLEHIKDHDAILKEVKRVGKYFVFEVPLEDNVNGRNLRKAPGNYAERIGHVVFFNRNSFKALIQRAGFVILKEKIMTPPYYVASFNLKGISKLKQLITVLVKRILLPLGFDKRFTYNYALYCAKDGPDHASEKSSLFEH
ncbi:MAG: class I SAM-dependent methyltransferase [Nitrospinae bacterium]|nr:class I SAM-dependent methyltransferase [Nitrospinota bacterium]